jgi:hypothetical protein
VAKDKENDRRYQSDKRLKAKAKLELMRVYAQSRSFIINPTLREICPPDVMEALLVFHQRMRSHNLLDQIDH